MPKAYWIAQVRVNDPEKYALYAKGATEAFALHGGRPLARGGKVQWLEGGERPRCVVIEFESMEAALACHRSAEYQAARSHRDQIAEVDLVIVEGLEDAP